jgi:hypothetical protein
MTSEELILAGSGDNAQWLKEIAYQLAVINESAGNYLADQKERSRQRDLPAEARHVKRLEEITREREEQERMEKAK